MRKLILKVDVSLDGFVGLAIFDGLEKPRALKLLSSSAFPGGATARVFSRELKTG